MHRRRYLRGAAVGLAALAGCLGEVSTGRDEPVPWTDPAATTPTITAFSELSSEAQHEFESALESGGHTEDAYEDLAIAEEASLVRYEGRVYAPSVSHGDPGGDYLLRLEPWSPRTTVPPANVTRSDGLSPAAREEVRAAIEAGEINSCEPFALADEVDLERSPYVAHEGTLYVALVGTREAEPGVDCETVRFLQLRPLR